MSLTSATQTIVERLGFSDSAAGYLTRDCGIDSMPEVAYSDGEDDVENTIKGVTSPGWAVTVGTWSSTVTFCNNGIPVSIGAVANLKLCVYYLKYMELVQRIPVATNIDLDLVCGYRDQQRYEANFKKTMAESVINEKDWTRTLENIKEYLASRCGGTGATLDYVIRAEAMVKPEAEDPAEDYTVDQ
jgi:hypothetical protein